MKRPLSDSQKARRGFTLFEVLVALSLSLLLISAVYSGLSLYWRYSMAGQADIERAQLARALLRKIELDVRCVMYRPAPAGTTSQSGSGTSTASSYTAGGGGGASGGGAGSSGGSGSGGGSGGSSSSASGSSGSGSSSSSSTEATAPEDAYGTSNTGLFGNATSLLMHVSKAGREQTAFSLAAAGNSQVRISDLATVAYFVSGAGTGMLQQLVTSPGLARLEGDRLALALADQQGNPATMAANTEILAPEVVAIKFTYFDGFTWRYDWDSSLLGGLPKAIEVEMQLRPDSRQGVQGTSASTPGFYRLLIPIPLAKPLDSSTVTTQ